MLIQKFVSFQFINAMGDTIAFRIYSNTEIKRKTAITGSIFSFLSNLNVIMSSCL